MRLLDEVRNTFCGTGRNWPAPSPWRTDLGSLWVWNSFWSSSALFLTLITLSREYYWYSRSLNKTTLALLYPFLPTLPLAHSDSVETTCTVGQTAMPRKRNCQLFQYICQNKILYPKRSVKKVAQLKTQYILMKPQKHLICSCWRTYWKAIQLPKHLFLPKFTK